MVKRQSVCFQVMFSQIKRGQFPDMMGNRRNFFHCMGLNY